MAEAYPHLLNHLLAGRLNLLGGDQITAHPVVLDSPAYAWHDYFSDISYYVNAALPAKVVTPTVVFDAEAKTATINVPDMVFTSSGTTPLSIWGIVFYKDTGTPTTSPLIALDLVGPIEMEAGLAFTYKQSEDGLLRLRIS